VSYAHAAWRIFLAWTARRLRCGRYVLEDLDAAVDRAKWACAREFHPGGDRGKRLIPPARSKH
jgi:hypothetical protein